jgi:hypothetical protein
MVELNLKKLLHEIFLRSPTNLFDEFINECAKWYEKPAHSFTEMRTRSNKKIRGDIFEDFCVLYLLHIKKYEQVWRLEDVSDSILEELALKRRDMGIDIIVKHQNEYYAVQCKYKKHSNARKNSVSWKSLSTFYALCLRTGKQIESNKREWQKYIVMTNCDFARHEGEKSQKDISMCIGTFRKINKDEWLLMCDVKGTTLKEPLKEPLNEPEFLNEIVDDKKSKLSKDVNYDKPSKEDLRLLRLAYYDKKII